MGGSNLTVTIYIRKIIKSMIVACNTSLHCDHGSDCKQQYWYLHKLYTIKLRIITLIHTLLKLKGVTPLPLNLRVPFSSKSLLAPVEQKIS